MSRALLFCGDPGIPLNAPCGAAAHLRGIAQALGEDGYQVQVATPKRTDHRGEVLSTLEGVHHTHVARRWPSWLRGRAESWQARQLMRRALQERPGPDWLWERHALFVDAGMRWAQQNRRPRLVELNAPLSLERMRYSGMKPSRYATRLEKRTLASADRVIAVSTWLADHAVKLGCHPDKVRYIPNGTHLTTSRRRQETRAALGFDGMWIGFVGGMRPWHGTERLRAIVEALPDSRLLIIGTGPTQLAHPRVVHIPWLSDEALADHIAAMDVALAPMAPDAAPWFGPLKIADYKSQGTPIVASRFGDLAERVRGCGEVVSTGNADGWVAAIRRQAQRRYPPNTRSWRNVTREALAGFAT